MSHDKRIEEEITTGLVSIIYDTIIDEVELIPGGMILKTFTNDMTSYEEVKVTFYSFVHEMRMFILASGFDMSIDIFVDNDEEHTIRYQVQLDKIERFQYGMWTSNHINELFLGISELETMLITCKWVAKYIKYEKED